MSNSITVCKDCTERSRACHDQCEKYISEKKKREEEKALLAEQKKADELYVDYKMKKRRHGKW